MKSKDECELSPEMAGTPSEHAGDVRTELGGFVVTYQSPCYRPELVSRRYVRRMALGPDYAWCETGEDRRDIRQGHVRKAGLPPHIADKADELRGEAFGYVVWPIQTEPTP